MRVDARLEDLFARHVLLLLRRPVESVPPVQGRRAYVRDPTTEVAMPAKTKKQRKFMGAELQRKREGKKTKTDMSEQELERMASKKQS
jgi:hypothetical protein